MKKTLTAAAIATGAFAVIVFIADRIDARSYQDFMVSYRNSWTGEVPPSTVG